jgi:hypothetical protein
VDGLFVPSASMTMVTAANSFSAVGALVDAQLMLS